MIFMTHDASLKSEGAGNAEKVVSRTIELDRQTMQSEFDTVQNKMPNVFFIMCLDIAQIIFQIFELPLDQKIRTTRIIGVFLRLENELQDGAALGLPGHRGRSGAPQGGRHSIGQRKCPYWTVTSCFRSPRQNPAIAPLSRSTILVKSDSLSVGRIGSRMLAAILSKLMSAVARLALSCSKALHISLATLSSSRAPNLAATGSTICSASFAISPFISNPSLITLLSSGVPVVAILAAVSLWMVSLRRLPTISRNKDRRVLSTLNIRCCVPASHQSTHHGPGVLLAHSGKNPSYL